MPNSDTLVPPWSSLVRNNNNDNEDSSRLALVRGLMDALRVSRDPISEREAHRGVPGCIVTATDVELLELKPFRMFRAGEIVAYEDNHASSPPPPPPPSTTSAAPARVVMRYARVVSAGDAGAAGVRMVQLRIAGSGNGNGGVGSEGGGGNVSVVTLLATEVFSFKSAREVAAARANASTQGSGLGVSPVMGVSSLRPPLPPPTGPDPSSLGTQATGVSPGTSAAISHPHPHQQSVGTHEVLNALNSLLVRAGIPLAPNEQSLVAKVVELDSQNKQLQTDLSQERVALNDLRVELQQATVAYRCQICVTEAVSIVMVPCGHVTCGTCSASLRGSRCPFCRSAIQQKVQVFHSADA